MEITLIYDCGVIVLLISHVFLLDNYLVQDLIKGFSTMVYGGNRHGFNSLQKEEGSSFVCILF